MATDLQSVLDELTAYPSTEHPFLSVYLDMVPDGNGQRQSLLNLDQDFDRLADQIKARDGDLASFEADRERIMSYLDGEVPTDARGLAIFACNAEGVWNAVPLQVQVPTQVVEDHYPHTFNLARIIDDHETFAVVLADSQESRIFVISLNDAARVAKTASDEPIKRFEAGGWAQMLFQRRTENIVKAHTKDIAATLGRIMKRYDVEHVIIAGNDSIKGHVMASLPKPIKEKLVDYIHLDINSNIQSIMETIEPMMREVERNQEAEDVADLETQVNTRGGLGFVGTADVATALFKGQVRMLLMLPDFNAGGGECPTCNALRPGMRPTCPYDGTEMQQVNLREAFVARASQQNASIQIVESNEFLAAHEGVGALLWYRDDVDALQAKTA